MKTPMNQYERILVLDAALVANEENPEIPPHIHGAMNQIQDWLQEHADQHYKDKDFGSFLSDQFDAVMKLKDSPEVFGYDHGLPV